MNFRLSAKAIEKESDLSSDLSMDTGWATTRNRPVVQPKVVQTDGLDPAALGGSSPLNGTGPLGEKVVTDPLVPVPQKDQGGPIPSSGTSTDVDTTTLRPWRQRKIQ